MHNYSVFDVGSILSLQYLGLLALKSIAGIEPELFHLQNSLIQTILMSSQMQTNQGNYKQNEIKSLIAPIFVRTENMNRKRCWTNFLNTAIACNKSRNDNGQTGRAFDYYSNYLLRHQSIFRKTKILWLANKFIAIYFVFVFSISKTKCEHWNSASQQRAKCECFKMGTIAGANSFCKNALQILFQSLSWFYYDFN